MGTYAITLNNSINNFAAKRQELINRFYAIINTYTDGNKYRHKELVLQESDNNVGLGWGTVWWDEKKDSYQMIQGIGGGSNKLLEVDSTNKWVFKKQISGHPKIFGGIGWGWIYSKKLNTYYIIGAGTGEYDSDYNPTPRGYFFSDPNSSMCYDYKRNYIITSGSRFDGVVGKWITQLDLEGEVTNEGGGLTNQLARNYLNQTSGNAVKFLTHSTHDDMYYYSEDNNIIKVNPTTGVATTIITKGTDILGLMIEEGSQIGYYAYVDGDDVKLTKFDLSTPATVYTVVNLGDIDYFVFLYVGKTIIVNCKITAFNSGAWYTISFNTDLTKNLTYEKYLFENYSGALTDPMDASHQTYASTISGKHYAPINLNQKFKPLSNDEVDINIPVTLGGGGSNGGTSSVVLNVNPVTAYPVVTEPTTEDCCLDELKCEINTKLAKKSCEATNRAIVGRHYSGMFKDSELLEALLWITTFDCLTCDEIEKLRCITSKI
tara:strand:+ start:9490 stop:10959 length:1470 start_codon:yes stop_codon:yes gene_type:complete